MPKYKDEDSKQKERIESKNQLENYAYTIRSSLQDEALAGKLSEDDKKKLNTAVDAALSWLDTHQGSTKEEFEAKRKELENTAMPIMSKLAGEAGGPGGGAPGGFPGAGGFPGGGFPGGGFPGGPGGPTSPPYGGGPTVDDVD